MSKGVESIFDRMEKTTQVYVDIWSSVEPYSIEKANTNAKRKNEKADRSMPLLAYAGMVPHVTAEELMVRYDQRNQDYAQHMLECYQNLLQKAKRVVLEMAELIDEKELQDLEAYRVRVYPPGLEYDLEYWKKHIKEKRG